MKHLKTNRKVAGKKPTVVQPSNQITTMAISASTIRGKTTASNAFNVFLQEKKMPNFDKASEDTICKEELFVEFCQYLVNLKTKNGEKDNISFGTAKQYLSGVFNVVRDKFRQNRLFVDTDWYKNLINSLETIISRRLIDEGKKLQEKSLPIGRKLMIDIIRTLLNENSKESVEIRACLVNDFCSIGRY